MRKALLLVIAFLASSIAAVEIAAAEPPPDPFSQDRTRLLELRGRLESARAASKFYRELVWNRTAKLGKAQRDYDVRYREICGGEQERFILEWERRHGRQYPGGWGRLVERCGKLLSEKNSELNRLSTSLNEAQSALERQLAAEKELEENFRATAGQYLAQVALQMAMTRTPQPTRSNIRSGSRAGPPVTHRRSSNPTRRRHYAAPHRHRYVAPHQRRRPPTPHRQRGGVDWWRQLRNMPLPSRM